MFAHSVRAHPILTNEENDFPLLILEDGINMRKIGWQTAPHARYLVRIAIVQISRRSETPVILWRHDPNEMRQMENQISEIQVSRLQQYK